MNIPQPSPSPAINGASIEMMDSAANPIALKQLSIQLTTMEPSNNRINSIDADFIASQQMIEIDPPSSTTTLQSRYTSHQSVISDRVHDNVIHNASPSGDSVSANTPTTMGMDHEQLRSKYIRLKHDYKETKSLRQQNEHLTRNMHQLQRRIEELEQSVVEQRDTIVQQNRHLLTLQSERDDFADTVEEQKEEKRMSQRLSLLNRMSGDHHGVDPHHRSVTTPTLNPTLSPLAVSEKMRTLPDEDEEYFDDEEFKLLETDHNHHEKDDGDDDDHDTDHGDHDDEEKMVVISATPGGPDDDRNHTNNTHDLNDGNYRKNTLNSNRGGRKVSTVSGAKHKNSAFAMVDDITADVQRRYTSQSRTVLQSTINPRKVEVEWSKIIGPHLDDETILEQSTEICDAWTIDECQCVHRLLFVLKYYSQWLNHKAVLQNRKNREQRNGKSGHRTDRNVTENKGYSDSIYEFVNQDLKHYSHVQLLNDFYHVKEYHLSMESRCRDTVYTYFVNEFGFCDVKHCTSFKRNHGEKIYFGHYNRFRRKVYHCDCQRISKMNEYDENGDNDYELKEIAMQQCLDMLHSTLIHDHHNTTTDDLTEFGRSLLRGPAPNEEDVEYSYSGNGNTKGHTPVTPHSPVLAGGTSTVSMIKVQSASTSNMEPLKLKNHGSGQSVHSMKSSGDLGGIGFIGKSHMAIASTSSIRSFSGYHGHNTSGDAGNLSPISPPSNQLNDVLSPSSHPSKMGIPIPKSPQRLDPESSTQDLFVFGFGVRFSYWCPEWPDYVPPKFEDLRSELLENDLYRISPLQWDLLQSRAEVFQQTDHYKRLFVAKHHGSGNALMRIGAGAQLSTDHLIALFSYATYPNLRLSFQKACLRTNSTETFVEVRSRHRHIAHWARLLYEAVYLFGTRMTEKQSFYHILRSKIMFREFHANLSCPTTMIANRKIVNNSNIVMQVKNANSRGATYLDLSCFSDVPNREERLFFFGDLAIDNIILKGKSHRHYIKSLTLFQKLVQGSYFCHLSLRKKEYQSTICHFMRNMLKSKDHGGTSNYLDMLRQRKKYNDEDIIEENEVPLYMQHLFDYFCSHLKTLWINSEEFCQLEKSLARYLAKETDTKSSITSMQEMMTRNYERSRQSLMGSFTKFLHFEYAVNLKKCCTLRWEISGNAKRNFWKGQKVFGEEFRVSTIRLFPYVVKDSTKDDGQFRFGIPVKSMPKHLRKIEFRVDLYIKEIDFTFSAFTIIDDRGTYFYSLFDSSLLRKCDRFTLRISFRLINLVVDDGIGMHSAPRHKGSFHTPVSRSISLWKLDSFRSKNSGANKGSVRSRISSKLRKTNIGSY